MKIKTSIVFLVSALLFLLYSCDSSTNPPPEEKPPGYQEDVPWPSLADSPWPISNHDPQATGRSNFEGPSDGIIVGEFNAFKQIQCGVVLDSENNIYFGNGFSLEGLYSINLSGELNWKTNFGSVKIFTTPVITSDGQIISTDGLKNVYSFGLNGDSLWTYELSGGNILQKNIILDKAGNIIIYDMSKIYSINKNGELNWEFSDNLLVHNRPVQLSISPDGKTLYIPGSSKSLIAFDLEGISIKWSFGDDYSISSMVDNAGNIYFQTTKGLYSLLPSGTERWFFMTSGEIGESSPSITKNGNIYFATDTLFALDYSGVLKWKKPLNALCDAPLICDLNESVFVGAVGDRVTFSAYNINGDLLWNMSIEGTFLYGSPAITNNKKIVFPIYLNKILFIN